MAAHQAPPSLGFSRQERWSGLPFPSPMHESEKWKWSRSVVPDSSQPHGLQPTRLLRPWDFPGKSTGVGCRRHRFNSWSERSPGEGNGNPLSSILAWEIPWAEEPDGLQAYQARVTKSQICLKQLNNNKHFFNKSFFAEFSGVWCFPEWITCKKMIVWEILV